MLNLAKGMTVLIRKNMYPTLQIANGTLGIVHTISTNYVGVYFEHLKDRIFHPTLPNGVVPIQKCSIAFQWKKDEKISRKQFPMSPAKALTVYAVQGKSLAKAVIHLSKSMTLSLIYVALSRVSNLTDLLLIGTRNLGPLFDSKSWSDAILQEVQRLKIRQAPTLARLLRLYPFLNDNILKEEAMLEMM